MRKGINPPKFADRFFRTDFDSEPMPVISLYPIPVSLALASVQIDVCGLAQHPRPIVWSVLSRLPRVKLKIPLICQIFNWSEEVEWEGIRLVDLLDFLKVETDSFGYFAFYSRDRIFFEGLSLNEARDPRVLLAYGLNGMPLPAVHGGPLRLVVPFLQGYKSVKWLRAIYAYCRDPIGTKRLLGQSDSSRLNDRWRKKYQDNYPMLPPAGRAGDPQAPHTVVQDIESNKIAAPVPSSEALAPIEGQLVSQGSGIKKSKRSVGQLKEVIAILRPSKHIVTRRALEAAGILSYTTYTVLGRSHQRGLRYQSDAMDEKEGVAIKFLPKQYFSIVIPESLLSAAIAVIMKANRSGKGAMGDGRIFVCDIEDAVRISTDEQGAAAVS